MPIKPNEHEEEYFAPLEFERRKKKALAEEERSQVPTGARNHCPRCAAVLVPVPYRGVELDKCSKCDGVWLDCGELERVIATDDDRTFLSGLRRIFR
ncbi:MAG: zf-TFIIB domain-containing protein [Candidatus Rokuibacteriota bacterium]